MTATPQPFFSFKLAFVPVSLNSSSSLSFDLQTHLPRLKYLQSTLHRTMASLAIGHVVIIGAGLAGLGLAQGLKRNGIDFSIYERDPAVDYRAQGYRIKIFPDTIEHLKQLLSSELWEEFESSCAETVMGESTVNALTANLISSRALAGVKPYTVDRGVMRNVLIQGLEGKIHFGKDLREYTINTDGVTGFFSRWLGSLWITSRWG